MEELNVMLADLASEGSVDSSGEFTVRLDKAAEKLAAYQLANPALFVLNLVAAAVTSGASHFRVETRECETTFAFDARLGYQDEQLQDLFSIILNPSAPAHLRELALAVHGARALPGGPEIALCLGERKLQVSEERIFVEPVPFSAGVVLSLTYPERGLWNRMVSPADRRGGSVLQNLFHYCRFAPLSLRDNGQSKGSPLSLGVYDSAVFAHRYLQGSQPMKVVAVDRRHDLFVSVKTQSPVASSIAISLGTPGAVQTHGFVLISRGVAFGRPASELLFPLATVAVSADHLEKNLSQSDLVEDDAYRALLDAVRLEVEDLVLELCMDPPAGWSSSTARHFSDALAVRYPRGDAPFQVQAFHRLNDMKLLCQTPQGRVEQMEFWRTLDATDGAAAKKFARSMGKAMEKLALEHLAKERWEDAFGSLQSLYELRGMPPDALCAVVLALAGHDQAARSVYTPGLAEYSPALAHLLGWTETLEGDGIFAQFVRFERAVSALDWQTADHLAADLEERPANLMLPLWLGWYALSMGRANKAAALWERSLKGLSYRRRQRWAEVLWLELRGRTSFLVQVGWHVRRRREELELAMGNRGDSAGALIDTGDWARDVWKLRIRGDFTGADWTFRIGFLSSLLHGQSLKLLPKTFLDTRLVDQRHR